MFQIPPPLPFPIEIMSTGRLSPGALSSFTDTSSSAHDHFPIQPSALLLYPKAKAAPVFSLAGGALVQKSKWDSALLTTSAPSASLPERQSSYPVSARGMTVEPNSKSAPLLLRLSAQHALLSHNPALTRAGPHTTYPLLRLPEGV